MTRFRKSELLVAVILITTLTSVMATGQLETPYLAWLHTISESREWRDQGNGIAIDPSGYAYVAGGSNSPVILKMNANGGFEWARVLEETGVGIIADTNNRGTVFLAGTLGNESSYPDEPLLAQEAFLAALDTHGGLEWSSVWGPPAGSNDTYWFSPEGLAVDAYGDAYLSGALGIASTLGTISYANSSYAFLIKFNSIGDLEWSRVWNFTKVRGDCPDLCFGVSSIASDARGNIIVAGHAGNDTLLARFNSNGNLAWGRVLSEENRQLEPVAITIDPLGNIYGIADTVVYGLGGKYTGYWQEYFGGVLLAKFAPNGSASWIKRLKANQDLPDPDYYNQSWINAGYSGYLVSGEGLAIDPEGALYALGDRNDQFSGNGDTFVAKFTSEGKLYWDVGTLPYSGCALSECVSFVTPNGIALDSASSVYVSGTSVYYSGATTEPLNNPPHAPTSLSAILTAQANVTMHDSTPNFTEQGFTAQHSAFKVSATNITLDEPPPPTNSSFISRMFVMKLEQYGPTPTTIRTTIPETTTTAITSTITTSEAQRPDVGVLLIVASVAFGIAVGFVIAFMIIRRKSNKPS